VRAVRFLFTTDQGADAKYSYLSTASSLASDVPAHPLAAQRRLVKALSIDAAPPRRSISPPRDLAAVAASAPGLPYGLERELFDDLFLGDTPAPTANPMLISPGFPVPIIDHAHMQDHGFGVPFIESWAAFNEAPYSLGAPSYLEP
jgi:hypothetical protein